MTHVNVQIEHRALKRLCAMELSHDQELACPHLLIQVKKTYLFYNILCYQTTMLRTLTSFYNVTLIRDVEVVRQRADNPFKGC